MGLKKTVIKKVKTKIPEKLKNEKNLDDSVEFFKDILSAAFRNDDFCLKLIQTGLKPEFFPRPYLKWMYATLKKYLDIPKYKGKIPSLKVMKDQLEMDKEIDLNKKAAMYLKMKEIFTRNVRNEEYSLDVVERVVRRVKFKNILESTMNELESFKDPNVAINNLVSQSFEISEKKKFEIVDLFSEYRQRELMRANIRKNPHVYKRFFLKFLPTIHNCLPGGLMAPMMMSVAAKTGRGKSITTITFGTEAQKQGFNVTHVTSENENSQTTGRYDSNITQIKYNDIQLDGLSKKQRKKYHLRFKKLNKQKNKIKIVKFSPNEFNASSIMQVLNILESQGHKTEILIVDSPDLMQPVSNIRDKRLQQAAIYWELKCVLEEKKCIGIVTTQLKQMSSDENPLAEDLSESYDKARMLDLLLVISQSKTQKANKEATIAVVKNRDGDVPSDFITIDTQFEKMTFVEKKIDEDDDEKPKPIEKSESEKPGTTKDGDAKTKLRVITGGKTREEKLKNAYQEKRKKKNKSNDK